MKSVAYLSLLFVTLVAIGQQLSHWPHLPEKVASHFGPQGQPDGFMDKGSYVLMLLALNVGLPLLMAGLAAVIKYIPNGLINVPHREYWLHPARRESTLEDTSLMLTWIGTGTGLFLIALAHITYRANVDEAAISTPTFWLLFSVYMLAIGAFCVRHYVRYRLPKPQ